MAVLNGRESVGLKPFGGSADKKAAHRANSGGKMPHQQNAQLPTIFADLGQLSQDLAAKAARSKSAKSEESHAGEKRDTAGEQS